MGGDSAEESPLPALPPKKRRPSLLPRGQQFDNDAAEAVAALAIDGHSFHATFADWATAIGAWPVLPVNAPCDVPAITLEGWRRHGLPGIGGSMSGPVVLYG